MTSPLFSFLTTAYGTEQYLPGTIKSVLAQTDRNWELIVVDNGNSDAMAQIIEGYAAEDDRIRMVRQPNKGYRGGVAAAADVATGTFVCVLDSDDQLLPEFCATVRAVLDSNPSVDAVGIDAYRFGEPEDLDLPVAYMRSIGVKEAADPGRRVTLTELLGGAIPFYTAAIRRSAWDAVGGYEPGVEDVDESVIIWCRLVERYDVRLLPDRLARYRLRPDSLSRDPAKVEEFERQLMRSFVEGAGDCRSPAERRALTKTLGLLRYQQAIRRARYGLLDGDIPTARCEAKAAFAERRTARAASIMMILTVAPTALRRLHPIKSWMTARAEYVLGRRRQRRSAEPG